MGGSFCRQRPGGGAILQLELGAVGTTVFHCEHITLSFAMKSQSWNVGQSLGYPTSCSNQTLKLKMAEFQLMLQERWRKDISGGTRRTRLEGNSGQHGRHCQEVIRERDS